MTTFKRILCPTDFSESSLQALDAAVRLAANGTTEMCLLHVELQIAPHDLGGDLSPQSAARHRAEAVRNLCAVIDERTPPQVRTNTLLRHGDAAFEIIKAAREQQADLIVLAAHGGGRHEANTLGTVATAVLNDAPCPVLVTNVPGDDVILEPGRTAAVAMANQNFTGKTHVCRSCSNCASPQPGKECAKTTARRGALRPEFEIVHAGPHAIHLDGD